MPKTQPENPPFKDWKQFRLADGYSQCCQTGRISRYSFPLTRMPPWSAGRLPPRRKSRHWRNPSVPAENLAVNFGLSEAKVIHT